MGVLKIWDKNYYNHTRLSPHPGVPLRGLALSPGSQKFVTCADEPAVKIWDFKTLAEERRLEGLVVCRCIIYVRAHGLYIP